MQMEMAFSIWRSGMPSERSGATTKEKRLEVPLKSPKRKTMQPGLPSTSSTQATKASNQWICKKFSRPLVPSKLQWMENDPNLKIADRVFIRHVETHPMKSLNT